MWTLKGAHPVLLWLLPWKHPASTDISEQTLELDRDLCLLTSSKSWRKAAYSSVFEYKNAQIEEDQYFSSITSVLESSAFNDPKCHLCLYFKGRSAEFKDSTPPLKTCTCRKILNVSSKNSEAQQDFCFKQVSREVNVRNHFLGAVLWGHDLFPQGKLKNTKKQTAI